MIANLSDLLSTPITHLLAMDADDILAWLPVAADIARRRFP